MSKSIVQASNHLLLITLSGSGREGGWQTSKMDKLENLRQRTAR